MCQSFKFSLIAPFSEYAILETFENQVPSVKDVNEVRLSLSKD